MNPKVREVQVGQFSTGGVGHFYPGANSRDLMSRIDAISARGILALCRPAVGSATHRNATSLMTLGRIYDSSEL